MTIRESAFYVFRNPQWKTLLSVTGLITFGVTVYALLVAGGFLYVVGVRPLAVMMAVIPVLVAILGVGFVCLGYCWEVWAALQYQENVERLPGFRAWPRYLVEGAQLVLFYLFLTAFLVACTFVFYPAGLIIPVLLVVFYPLMLVPPLFSGRDKTFLGLLDGCLDVFSMFNRHYFSLWAESTLYLLFVAGLVYPLAMVMVGSTGLGLLLLPGLVCACAIGYGALLIHYTRRSTASATLGHYAAETALQKAPLPTTSFSTMTFRQQAPRSPWHQAP